MEDYNQLAFYTLALQDHRFIHQYVVDAYAAQNADKGSKPIKLYFALAGLYLNLEKNYSGKEVQDAHILMANNKDRLPEGWPTFNIPEHRGEITADHVLKEKEGKERDEMISKWSMSVWEAYKSEHEKVRKYTNTNLGL